MENIKAAETMKRHEVIFALAAHIGPTSYHSLLAWPTPQLKALLTYCRASTKEELEAGMNPIYVVNPGRSHKRILVAVCLCGTTH